MRKQGKSWWGEGEGDEGQGNKGEGAKDHTPTDNINVEPKKA